MRSLKKQKGLSALGWLVVIMIFGFTLLVTSKLGPHYLDNRFVIETLETLGSDPAFPRMSPGEIRSKLDKTFNINNIRGQATESVKVTKNNEGTLVQIKYEERVHLMQNIDVVLTFNSVLDSNKPDECCRPPLR